LKFQKLKFAKFDRGAQHSTAQHSTAQHSKTLHFNFQKNEKLILVLIYKYSIRKMNRKVIIFIDRV
jgi:hypothetical protein